VLCGEARRDYLCVVGIRIWLEIEKSYLVFRFVIGLIDAFYLEMILRKSIKKLSLEKATKKVS
jgi:hypothetical protein